MSDVTVYNAHAAQLLRRPFTPQAVKFKVQSTWPKVNPDSALVVVYIDARLVVERLNHVVPSIWWDEYEQVGDKRLRCKLHVGDLARTDVGEGTGKGLYSDALKRAAVKFGVGVSLYAVPRIVLKGADVLKPINTKAGPSLALKVAGEQQCRERYAQWLAEAGEQAFGEALDHGDPLGAVGEVNEDDAVPEAVDAEPEAQPPVESPALEDTGGEAPPAEPDPEVVALLVNDLAANKLLGTQLRQRITMAVGADPGPVDTPAQATAALERTTVRVCNAIELWLTQQEQGARR